MKQYHKNPRQITHKQYGDLEKWLAQFGDLSGITHNLPTDETITGNQRCRVIDINECEIVIEHKLDDPDEQGTVGLGYVIWQGHRYGYRQVVWDERTAEAANIIANRAGGSWDVDILANEWQLDDLLEWGFEENDLQLDWGSDDPTPDPGAQVDKASELQEKWGVKRGDVWLAGRHRIMCGDSTCAEDVARLMNGERAAMVWTDPPYATFASSTGKLESTDYQMIKPFFGLLIGMIAANLTSGRGAFICCDWRSYPALFEKLIGAMSPRNLIVWYHGAIKMGSQFRPCYELMTYATNDKFGQSWGAPSRAWKILDRGASDVWEIKQAEAAPGVNREHSSQKPVALVSKAIGHCSNKDEEVLDLFLGSGTTIVACEQTGRVGYGMEISEKYVAVTLQRLQDMGLDPQLVEQ